MAIRKLPLRVIIFTAAVGLLAGPQLAVAYGGGHGGGHGGGGGGHHDDDDGGGHHDDDDDGGCEEIDGKFGAMSVPVPPCASPVGLCTLGTLKGDLRGTYELVVATSVPTGNPATPTVLFFTGTSVVELNNGSTWTGIDSGALNVAPPGVVGSGSFSTLLTFTDGVAGWLHIRGVLDLASGQVSGKYNGTVCFDED